MNDVEIAHHGQVRRLAGLGRDLLEQRTSAAQQRAAAQEGLAELEAASTEAVAVAVRALLDVTLELERRE